MSEIFQDKQIVLKHHEQLVKFEYPGITVIADARKSAEKKLTRLRVSKQELIFKGKYYFIHKYPFLKQPANYNKFLESYAQMIVAVNTDNCITIPDKDPQGSSNYDDLCRNCGNLEPSNVTSYGYLCNIRLRVLERMAELEQLNHQELH